MKTWRNIYPWSYLIYVVGMSAGRTVERLARGDSPRQALIGVSHPGWAMTIPAFLLGAALAVWQSRWVKKVIDQKEDSRVLKWLLNAAYRDMQPNGVCGDIHEQGGLRETLRNYLKQRDWLDKP